MTSVAEANLKAFLDLIAWAEGTDSVADPYRVCYGYRHRIVDLSEHPAVRRANGTREWEGEKLPDHMCRGAGLNPGCVSTAAGRYQIIRPTWVRLRDLLRLPDFGPKSQDAAAVQLLRERNALPFIESGRIDLAVARAKSEWASLPGNAAGQPQRQLRDLLAVYTRSGGTMA